MGSSYGPGGRANFCSESGLNPMAALQGNWEVESSPALERKGSLKATVRATPGCPLGPLPHEVLEDRDDSPGA